MKLLEKLEESTFKKLVAIPIILLLVAGLLLALSYVQTGTVLQRSIDLEGGLQVTLHYTQPVDTNQLEATIRDSLGVADVTAVTTTDPATREQETLIVSIGGEADSQNVVAAIESSLGITLEPTTYSIRQVGASLAGSFWQQAVWAFAFAFIFMAGVVFYNFRKVLPSGAIILAIMADIVVILGFMDLFGIRLSLATIAGLLMIIGYGTDSNIVLSTKLLKEHEGTPFSRVKGALKTGITMSITTMSALFALFILANSLVLKEIAAVLLLGLAADLVNTWLLNANIILWRQK